VAASEVPDADEPVSKPAVEPALEAEVVGEDLSDVDTQVEELVGGEGEPEEEGPEPTGGEGSATGEKKRRRRRRRRKGSKGDPRSETGAEVESAEEPDESPLEREEVPLSAEEDEEVVAVTPGQDDEEEDEVDNFSNWNVPSWQELIASLYRPS
jgi:ribonuclease E